MISQLPLEDIDEFLFGAETNENTSVIAVRDNIASKQPDTKGSNTTVPFAGSLPSKELFKIISIIPDAAIAIDEQEQS